jgi:biotin transport system substrate-specific component
MSDTTVWPAEGCIAISTRTALTVIVGAALMTLAAKVQVPFWPVPMTLHTLITARSI